MRIVHVIPYFLPSQHGGPIHAAFQMARVMQELGHQVTIVTTNRDVAGNLDVPLGSPVMRSDVEVRYYPTQTPHFWYFSSPLNHDLKEIIRRSDLVHIHTIYLFPTTAAAFWSSRYGVPFVVQPHGSLSPVSRLQPYEPSTFSMFFSRIKKAIYFRTLARNDLSKASGIVYTSEGEREFARALGLKVPTHVVPLFVDTPLANMGEHHRPSALKRPGTKTILFLSRIHPVKGFRELLRVLGELVKHRNDFRFVVAGSGTREHEQEFDALVREHGLSDVTVRLGWVSGNDKWCALKSADLFILPSHHENFGVSVAEAMAVGVPVIISDQVGIANQIALSGAGLVVRVGGEGLIQAINRLLDDAPLRSAMGENGRRLVEQTFSSNEVTRALLNVYDSILAGVSR